MAETLLEKAQRLGIQPAQKPAIPASETLLEKAQRLGIKPEEKKPGFFQGLVRGITKAPLQVGVTAAKLAGTTGALAETGIQKLLGNKEKSQEAFQIAQKRASSEPVNLGYFGKIRPLGVSETGEQLGLGGQIKQAAGIGTELASYAIGGPEAKAGITALRTGVAPKFLGMAREGAKIGGIAGAGTSLQDIAASKESTVKQAGEVLMGTGGSALAGAVLAPTIGGALLGAKAAPKFISSKAEKSVQKEIDNLIKSKTNLEKTTNFFEQKKGTPVREMIQDKNIYEGLNVQNNAINPDKAIEVAQSRIDRGMEIVSDLMPEIDKYAGKVNKADIRNKSVAWIKEQGLLPADETDIIKSIDNQINALPDEFLPSQLDALRAKARLSSRTARGQLKRDSEYAAIENASRDILFERADKLPQATGGEFSQLRNMIKQNIDLSEFLDKNLRGQKVKGGRLGTYTGKIVGAVAGSPMGIFGSIVGQEVGGRISNVLTNNQLGSSLKMKLIRKITDNPKAIVEAEKLLASQKGFKQLLLPAPAPIGSAKRPFLQGPAPLGKQK